MFKPSYLVTPLTKLRYMLPSHPAFGEPQDTGSGTQTNKQKHNYNNNDSVRW